MNKKNIRIVVHGLVQGVFYRQSTQQMATSLNLNGTVRNCDDGTVEIFAEGNENDVNELVEWCKKGPRGARVTKVQVENNSFMDFRDFKVVR